MSKSVNIALYKPLFGRIETDYKERDTLRDESS